ncbi:hypothetical protein Mpe_A3703 [Methylibium petroleiphilum PM1]|uniref:Uncharacterized protein n=1 Tax=Methylibium petroleiphilum (strain ATCC BAA-1232 / LMG 22953 / PM1) TaxID=420662 RepID=A2SM67_METPP|nr:hypothetical protein Mpe_A3703 [Methylibium petroleiphilum PM1]
MPLRHAGERSPAWRRSGALRLAFPAPRGAAQVGGQAGIDALVFVSERPQLRQVLPGIVSLPALRQATGGPLPSGCDRAGQGFGATGGLARGHGLNADGAHEMNLSVRSAEANDTILGKTLSPCARQGRLRRRTAKKRGIRPA